MSVATIKHMKEHKHVALDDTLKSYEAKQCKKPIIIILFCKLVLSDSLFQLIQITDALICLCNHAMTKHMQLSY